MNSKKQPGEHGPESPTWMPHGLLHGMPDLKGVPEAAKPMMRQSISMGEELVDYALQAQLDAAHSWAEAVRAADTGNGAMAQASDGLEGMAREWVRMRRAVWHGFFDGMRAMAGDAAAADPQAGRAR